MQAAAIDNTRDGPWSVVRRPAIVLILFSLGIGIALPLSMTPATGQSQDIAALHARYVELAKSGRFVEAIPIVEEAVLQAERRLGADHPETADVRHTLRSLAAPGSSSAPGTCSVQASAHSAIWGNFQ